MKYRLIMPFVAAALAIGCATHLGERPFGQSQYLGKYSPHRNLPICETKPRLAEKAPPEVPHPISLLLISPEYPVEALRDNQHGWVHLKFDITSDGRAENIEVVNSSPARIFDSEATKALAKWVFKPWVGSDGVAKSQPDSEYIVLFKTCLDEI